VDILFTSIPPGTKARMASRTGKGKWTVQALPMDMGHGVLLRTSTGGLAALINDDATQAATEYWEQTSGGWKKLDSKSPSEAGLPGATRIDSVGCVHTANPAAKGGGHVYGLRRASAWTEKTTLSGWAHAALTLAPSGAPHIAHWQYNSAGTGDLYLTTPPGKPVKVAQSPASTPFAIGSSIAAAATAKGEVFILAERWKKATLSYRELILARQSGGSWSVTTMAKGGHTPCYPCSTSSCSYDYHDYQPLAVVASASGDVRLLYAHWHHKGSLQGFTKYPGSPCVWLPVSDASSGEVRMAWPVPGGGGTLQDVSVAKGLNPAGRATAALDSKGRIHLAFMSSSDGLIIKTDIRYLVLGP